MSVLKNHRSVAYTEFENTFTALYQLSARRTSSVPKRRKKWVSDKIDVIMNRASMYVIAINSLYIYENKRDEVSKLASKAFNLLMTLEKRLIVLWNIEKYEVRKMAAWATLIRKELILLNKRILDDTKDEDIEMFMILDWQFIGKSEFCQNMCNLHRYTHGKVTNANCGFDSTHGSLLIDLVDSALYNVMKGNYKVPKTKAEYEKRAKCISTAISALKAMNRPLLFYFNVMHYSEEVMKTWSNMITKEIKLLCGLQQSDKKRFSELP